MMPMKIAALMLASMALAGLLLSAAGQRAFAHSFATDESATFIVDIKSAKVHIMLAGKNMDDPEAALGHIEHVRTIIDEAMLKEIAERNERIAEDIPAALDDLAAMIEDDEDRSVVVGQLREINGLFAEAISVRIDPEHLEDDTVKALIVAGFVSNALAAYEDYHGIEHTEHEHADETAHDSTDEHASMVEGEHMESSTDEHDSAMEESHSSHMSKRDSLMAAKSFINLAKSTYYREHLGDTNDDAMAAKDGLVELRDIIYGKRSIESATVATHQYIQANLQKAFDLELAEEDNHAEDEHDEEHSGDGEDAEHTEEN
jgi:hypothetical protein